MGRTVAVEILDGGSINSVVKSLERSGCTEASSRRRVGRSNAIGNPP